MEEWPPAIRPAIQGKAKILEDIILVDHKVTVINKMKGGPKTKQSGKASKADVIHDCTATASGQEKDASLIMMERMTPFLEGWLRESLQKLGVQGTGSTDKGKGKGKSSVKTEIRAPSNQRGEQEQPTTSNNVPEWRDVLGRKAKKVRGKLPPPGTSAIQTPQTQGKKKVQRAEQLGQKTTLNVKQGGQNGGGKTTKGSPVDGDKPPRQRPPRTAAVTLTCPPGGYAAAMKAIREKISLKELGIKELRPKKALTGALILEVLGSDGKEKAEKLKEKMREALQDQEGVRVARPEKMADIRLKDILDSAEVDEIREAIAVAGSCHLDEVKTGVIQAAASGLATVWARCPIRAAIKMVKMRRIQIGLTSSRVEMLPPRQIQCYKCLEKGHVQSACTSHVDRSMLCYKCGESGHMARHCGNKPCCPICREAGVPATHRMGGPACKAPPNKGKGKRRGDGAVPGTVSPANKMDVEPETLQPAVRGGPVHVGQTPVPVRSNEQDGKGVVPMEVDTESTSAPKEQRVRKGLEEPSNRE